MSLSSRERIEENITNMLGSQNISDFNTSLKIEKLTLLVA